VTIRGAVRALLLAGIVASSLVPSPALAVVPAWTTLFDAGEGLPIGSVGHQGSLYVLLVGYSARTECRVARLDPAGEVNWIRNVASGGTLG
jgi:hypothetical protein